LALSTFITKLVFNVDEQNHALMGTLITLFFKKIIRNYNKYYLSKSKEPKPREHLIHFESANQRNPDTKQHIHDVCMHPRTELGNQYYLRDIIT